MISKDQLRREIGAKRNALDFQWLENTSASIVERFQRLEEFQCAELVGLYKAISGEVNLEALFFNCWNLNKRTCIPVFNTHSRIYEMAEITAATDFRTGNFGIQEPVCPRLLEISDLDLIAVPAVGFDSTGNRLGRGGGYYDRILSIFSGTAVGVAFDFQIYPEIPTDLHDIPVSAIITESKFIKV